MWNRLCKCWLYSKQCVVFRSETLDLFAAQIFYFSFYLAQNCLSLFISLSLSLHLSLIQHISFSSLSGFFLDLFHCNSSNYRIYFTLPNCRMIMTGKWVAYSAPKMNWKGGEGKKAFVLDRSFWQIGAMAVVLYSSAAKWIQWFQWQAADHTSPYHHPLKQWLLQQLPDTWRHEKENTQRRTFH